MLHIYLFLFAALLFADEPMWQAGSEFYQNHTWWAIEITAPEGFMGSAQTITSTIGNFQMRSLGQDTSTQRFCHYLPISSDTTLLEISLSEGQKKSILVSENLSLKRLGINDRLIGIYGSERLTGLFRDKVRGLSPSLHVSRMPFLPSEWQAFENFHIVVLQNTALTQDTVKALCHWIYAGGVVWILDKAILEQPLWQTFLATARKEPLSKLLPKALVDARECTEALTLEYFDAGFGSLLFTPGADPEALSSLLDRFFPGLCSLLPFNEDPLPAPPLFSPLRWDQDSIVFFWILGSLYLLAFFIGEAFLPKRVSIRQRLFLQIGIVAVFIACFIGVASSRNSILRDALTLSQVESQDSLVLQKSYVAYQALRTTEFVESFGSLPMPLLMPKKGSALIEMTQRKELWEWRQTPFSRNAKALFYIENVSPFLGILEAKKDKEHRIMIENRSDLKFEEALYWERGFWQVWNRVHEPLLFSPTFQDYSQLPSCWNFLPWWKRKTGIQQAVLAWRDREILVVPIKAEE